MLHSSYLVFVKQQQHNTKTHTHTHTHTRQKTFPNYEDHKIATELIENLIKVGLLKFKKIFAKIKFSRPCSKKYHHLIVGCLKLKINEFQNCKICILKKQADLKSQLHQAVTFHINDCL